MQVSSEWYCRSLEVLKCHDLCLVIRVDSEFCEISWIESPSGELSSVSVAVLELRALSRSRVTGACSCSAQAGSIAARRGARLHAQKFYF